MNRLSVLAAVLLSVPAAVPGAAESNAAAPSVAAAADSGAAAPDTSHAADRKQLLAMLAGVEEGLNRRDIESVKKYLHPDAVVTFQDAKVVKGIAALAGYYNEKFGGPSAVLKSFSTQAAVDAPAVFFGDVAVAHGHTNDRFVFAGGKEFNLDSRWTATLRKDGGRWSVMALHFSADLFDNPLLNMATGKLKMVGAIALVLGLLVGAAGMRLAIRKS
jgi:ketosteroid isomerase-like protein